MLSLFVNAIKILMLGFLVWLFVVVCIIFSGCGDSKPTKIEDTSIGKFRLYETYQRDFEKSMQYALLMRRTTINSELNQALPKEEYQRLKQLAWDIYFSRLYKARYDRRVGQVGKDYTAKVWLLKSHTYMNK